MKKVGLLGIGVVLGLALILVGWRALNLNYQYQGALIDPAVPAPDFTLVGKAGQPFQLRDQSGQVVLLFFGYTHCPDVCPVTLSEYKQIKKRLGAQADKVRFVFITVDPERDTPDILGKYVSNFDPLFIGLSGDLEQLESVWTNYGVYRERKDVGSAAGYLMDHTAVMYAIDKQGSWRLTYGFGTPADQIAEDIIHLLREN